MYAPTIDTRMLDRMDADGAGGMNDTPDPIFAQPLEIPPFLAKPSQDAADQPLTPPAPAPELAVPSAADAGAPYRLVNRVHLRGIERWHDADLPDRLYRRPSSWVGRGDRIVNVESGRAQDRLSGWLLQMLTLGVVENRRTRNHSFDEFVAQDVVVLVPPCIYETFLDMAGVPIAHLIDRLSYLIAHDFKRRFMVGERGANVVVAPAAGLAVDEAVLLFGLGVFVPNQTDEREYEVELYVDTGSGPVPVPGAFTHSFTRPVPGQPACQSIQRAAGLYAKQKYLAIGADPTRAPLVLPASLGLAPETSLRISLSPDRARGDGVHMAREGAIVGTGDGVRIFRFPAAQPSAVPGRNLTLEVRLTPVAKDSAGTGTAEGGAKEAAKSAMASGGGRTSRTRPTPERREPRRSFWSFFGGGGDPKPQRDDRMPDLGPMTGKRPRTMPMPCQTIVLPEGAAGIFGDEGLSVLRSAASPYALSVELIALPRLPRTAKAPTRWTLALTPTGEVTGRPALSANQGVLNLALLGGQAGDAGLYATPVGGTAWVPVPEDGRLALLPQGRQAALVPVSGSIGERYHMLLRLPQPRPYPLLATGEQLIGRQSEAPAANGGDLPKVQFGLLDLPGTVEGPTNGTLEQINLSRDHVKAWVGEDERLFVSMNSGKTPVWRLGPNLDILDERSPGSCDPMALEIGDYLLLGCYVLRFGKIGD